MGARIWALVVKEFLTVLKDKRSRVVIVAMPLIQIFVFPFAATFEVEDVRVAVYNEDRGSMGRDLAARFAGAPAFVPVAQLSAHREIEEVIAAGRADLVVHMHPQFSRNLLSGGRAEVQLVLDGRNSNTALIVLNYARAVVDAYAEELSPRARPATLVTRAWFNPNLESQWFIIPGLMGILILIAALAITSFSVAREKEVGTFQQLLVTPLRPYEILLGKTVPALVIGLAEGAVIAGLAVGPYGLPFAGDPWLLLAGTVVFLLSIIGVGLAVSAVSRTQQQALFGAFLFNVPVVILSGFATPIDNMPQWVQWITYLNPLRYYLVIARGVFLKDLPAPLVAEQIWPMAVIAAATLALAAVLFRRRAM